MPRLGVVVLTAMALIGCSSNATTFDYVIIDQLPHDTSAYTQGLLYADGYLYESTGRLGSSQVRRVSPATGQVEAAVALPPDRFGEGLTLLDDRLYQLTWKSQVGYIYNLATLARVDSFAYAGEGWGLATDGNSLIMSDGTATLRFLDPRDFQVLREVTVRHDGLPLTQINELEYVGKYLFANIYRSDRLARIDPGSGEVQEFVDLANMFPIEQRPANSDVLNGIAFNDETGHFYITGKLWPTVFEVRLRSVTIDSVVGL